MFAVVRNTLKRSSTVVQPYIKTSQRATVISGPPAVHVSLAEKVVVSVMISLGVFATPMWVLKNMKYYRMPKPEE